MSKKEIVISPQLKICLENDVIDEIFSYDEDGECNFHLEKMSSKTTWMRWYSTKDRPLPEELVVHIGDGITHELDEPLNYDHEVAIFGDTKKDEFKKEVEHLIRYFGMKRLLEQMISSSEVIANGEDYIHKLASDLKTVLENYNSRYQG